MAKRDYYEVLGVERDADQRTIKKAYRQKAMELHPDRNPDNAEAEDLFKKAAEAYAVLSDENKKARYDQFGHAGLEGGAGFQNTGDVFTHFQDIFGDLFGMGGFRSRGRPDGPRAGSDVRTAIRLTLSEAANGVEKELPLNHAQPCDDCEGTGAKDGKLERCTVCGGNGQVQHRQGFFVVQTTCPQCRGAGVLPADACPTCAGSGEVERERIVKVTIPAGIDEGQSLRLTGQGQAGRRGGPPGNLFVEVQLETDETYERHGADLVHHLALTFPEAALGTTRAIPQIEGLDDEPHQVRVPAGIQPGDTIQVRGAGMPRLQRRGRGDLICVVQVDVPKELSPRARELIEELRETMS